METIDREREKEAKIKKEEATYQQHHAVAAVTTDATTAAVQTSLIWVETTHVSGSSFSSYSESSYYPLNVP